MTGVAEWFNALKPEGALAVVERIFDLHSETRTTVTDLAVAASFLEIGSGNNGPASALHCEKPSGKQSLINKGRLTVLSPRSSCRG